MSIPPDQYALYSEFGIAAEKAQALEVDAGTVALSFLALFVNTDEISPEQTEMFRSIEKDVNRKTLGKLLEHVKRLGSIDQSMLEIVDTGLERRNYLVHKFFSTHNYAIFDVTGRQAMVEELKDIQKALDFAHGVLDAMSSLLLALAGKDSMVPGIHAQLSAQGKQIRLF